MDNLCTKKFHIESWPASKAKVGHIIRFLLLTALVSILCLGVVPGIICWFLIIFCYAFREFYKFCVRRNILVEVEEDHLKITKLPRLFYKKEIQKIYFNEIIRIKMIHNIDAPSFFKIYLKNSSVDLHYGNNYGFLIYIKELHYELRSNNEEYKTREDNLVQRESNMYLGLTLIIAIPTIIIIIVSMIYTFFL